MGALLKIYGPAVLLTAAGFGLAYQFVDPAPPRTLAIASGATDGAYYRFAQAYREILAEEGVELVVRSTAGSVENLRLLSDAASGIDVAFVQGGAGGGAPPAGLLSLGSVYFEPLWVFHRPDRPIESLAALRGKALAVGPPGSGTRMIALDLLARSGVGEAQARLEPLGGRAAVEALEAGSIDALFLVAAADSPLVDELLRSPRVALMSFDRSEAYTRLYRYLSGVTLPQGVIDMQADLPPRDVELLAAAANLVGNQRLHPALVGLLLQAATRVHGAGGLFESSGEFPSKRFIDYPLSDEARRFYLRGPPFLQRYLPFWAATLIDRMLVMLLPLVALMVPLVKIMPPVYRWRMRARVYRWYRELLSIEPHVNAGSARAREDALRDLQRIEDEVSKVNVPMSFADQLYQLRSHIELVRARLQRAGGPEPPAAASDPGGGPERS